MIDYSIIIKRISGFRKYFSFTKATDSDILYLKGLNLSDDIIDFYKKYNPKNIFEINGIRLLSINKIKEENNDYTPGYILCPRGYCVIASTIFGDVYCVDTKTKENSIYIASHDEIDEEALELDNKIIFITDNFLDFLNKFVDGKLVKEFYDLTNK